MNNLAKIIKDRGLKKSYIANKLNIAVPTLQRYIEGINYPNIKKAYELSKILNLSIEDIFFNQNTI